jgi:ligand-binding sensor domain-containing protein
MTDTNIGDTEATEASSTTETTQAVRTYTQKEVDDMMAKTKTAVMKKVTSKYEELGDPEELKTIVSSYQKVQQEQQLKRGEFDKVIQELASKKDVEIQKRDRIIESFKVETPLMEAASRFRAVAPEQVKQLVRNNVRLNADGDVEVVDAEGKVRYDDSGRLLSVDSYVQEFLSKNPHFVQATPSTTSSRSNVAGGSNSKLDISKLDFKNPEHRKQYAEYRKTAGIGR